MDASNRRHIREAEKASKIEQVNDTAILSELLGLPHGRAWLWKQLAEGHIFRPTFTTNPLVTAFNEGNRSAALRLLNQILEVDPEGFISMVKEHARRTDAADAARDTADRAAGNNDPTSDDDDPTGGYENVLDYDPGAEAEPAEREGPGGRKDGW